MKIRVEISAHEMKVMLVKYLKQKLNLEPNDEILLADLSPVTVEIMTNELPKATSMTMFSNMPEIEEEED
jgi:hypothetical protein